MVNLNNENITFNILFLVEGPHSDDDFYCLFRHIENRILIYFQINIVY